MGLASADTETGTGTDNSVCARFGTGTGNDDKVDRRQV